jgi:hypothetical protein
MNSDRRGSARTRLSGVAVFSYRQFADATRAYSQTWARFRRIRLLICAHLMSHGEILAFHRRIQRIQRFA